MSLSLAQHPLPVRSAGWQLSFVGNGPVAARSWAMGSAGERTGSLLVGSRGTVSSSWGLSCRDLGLAWVTESSEATAMPRKHRVSMPGPPPNNAMNRTNRGVPGMKERRPSGEPVLAEVGPPVILSLDVAGYFSVMRPHGGVKE